MTRGEQKAFIDDLSNSIARKLINAIDTGHIPEEWDGHEIRCALEEMHRLSASMSLIKKYPRGKRAKDYKNVLLTTATFL